MENNSKKGLIGLVIVLGLLVVGLSSYLIYDKLFVDNNTKNKEEINDNKDEIGLISTEDAELVANFQKQIHGLEYLEFSDSNSKLKNGWFYENDKTLINELDNEKKIMIATKFNSDKIWDLSYKVKDDLYDYYYTLISKENLKSILLESGYINDETILNNISEINVGPIITYSSEYDAYILGSSYGFGLNLETYDYKFEKIEEKNEYYLYRSVANRIDDIKYTNITKLEDSEINKDNYNNYSKYKFTFKNYLLYSVEKVN